MVDQQKAMRTPAEISADIGRKKVEAQALRERAKAAALSKDREEAKRILADQQRIAKETTALIEEMREVVKRMREAGNVPLDFKGAGEEILDRLDDLLRDAGGKR